MPGYDQVFMRQDALVEVVNQFIATPPYEACLLLVHPDPAHLQQATRRLSEACHWPDWPVGRALAAALRDTAPPLRPTTAARWFRDTAAAHRPGPVLLSDIALLFEPALELQPLRLLLDAARQTKLIVAWPGARDGRRLTYAAPQHRHYREWPVSDLCPMCIVTL